MRVNGVYYGHMTTYAQRHTVLIIDDDENVLDIYSIKFTGAGYKVLLAGNGRDGLAIAFKEHPSIILLDIQLPDMRGTDALKVLRKDSWGASVPVIMLTNMQMDTPETVQAFVSGKPEFYLIKADWEPKDVLEKTEEVLYH